MKVKELDNILNEILENEAKKVIKEQIDDTDHLIDSIKGFPTLSGLLNKITEIEDAGATNGSVIFIHIQGVTPEELVNCCGGNSFGNAQTKLMQGLHHDLEDNGFGGDFDIDVDTSGDENALNIAIRITPNNDKGLTDVDMEAEEMDEKKEILLGSKKSCTECGKELSEDNVTGKCDECSNEMLNENKKGIETMKKTVTLSEAEMAELIKKVVLEGVPGVDTTASVTKEAGKQNNEALKAVEKKIKDYLTFKGNDKPEFPNQIGQGEDKAARKNTTDQEKEIDLNRGQGIGDADYDQEPDKMFKDRQEKAIKGSSEMGNPTDAANAIKTDVGEKVLQGIKARKEAKKEEPLYAKEPVPVKTEKKSEPERIVNEAAQNEIAKMKRLVSYNEKTQ